MSLAQSALPLLALASAISLATLAWNESIVPETTRRWQDVINVEIRKGAQHSILSEHEIWYHGADGFYNVEHVDARGGVLLGLTVYRTDPAFDLRSIIEVRRARWTGTGWENHDAVEHSMGPGGEITTQPLPPDQLVIHETLSDFLEVRRQPEELSYHALRERLDKLSREGIDASSDLVDLYLKLAVPFTTLVFACVAIPLAGRVQRHPSIAAIVGVGVLIGFAYWVVLGLSNALGQSRILPAALSAWFANITFLLVGLGLFLSTE